MAPNEQTDPGDHAAYRPADAVSDEPSEISANTDTAADRSSQTRFGLVVVALMVFVADITLYKAYGFAGPAVFFLVAPLLLWTGVPKTRVRFTTLFVCLLIGWLSWRMLVAGNMTLVIVGFWLVFALACVFRGRSPFVMETLTFALECLPEGIGYFLKINDRLRTRVLDPVDDAGRPSRSAEILLPLVSLVVFGGVFVMANPDMVSWVSVRLGDLATLVRDFFFQFSVGEMLFWVCVAVVTGGMLRPIAPLLSGAPATEPPSSQSHDAPLYAAFRNTLLTVIALFLCYLAFESRAFLIRKPPQGFTFSSYAHEGAAWLTIALALATLTLSLIFRGRMLSDPRLQQLQRLAWVWSALNFLLAIAVYNRMLIYINFNGMTRMRVIALLGITSVVCGFALVVVKILLRRPFWWLVQRQLWVLGFAIYLNAILPVDRLIHTWNVQRIMAGNHAPVVQITAHDVDSEALPVLLPLCEHPDALIADGICAMIANRMPSVQECVDVQESRGWTAWQQHHQKTLTALKKGRTRWDQFGGDRQKQTDAWSQLQNHAYYTWW